MKTQKLWIMMFILFLTLPTVLYGIAYSVIDHENRENREYASFPRVSEVGYAGLPGGIQEYYNDRIPFKNQFKTMRTVFDIAFQKYESRYFWATGTPIVLKGREGWLYYTPSEPGEDAVGDYQGLNTYTEEELKMYAESFQKLSDYYEDQGITFVFFVAPGKESIYTEFMPEYYPERAEKSRYEVFTEYLQEHTTVKAVYPRELLRANLDVCTLFFKNDSHWNDAGAYLGTKSVIDLISEDPMPELKDVDPVISGTREGGDLSNILGITGKASEDAVIELKNFRPDVQVQEIGKRHSISDAEDQRKCIVLGDSFSSAMYRVLSRCFKEVNIARGTDVFKEMLQQGAQKPDIIIWEVAERYGDRMSWLDILMGLDDQDQEAEGFDAI